MTLTLRNDAGYIEVSAVLVEATSEFAERMAELTVVALNELGYPPEKASFPSWFLLELAAVQQILLWQQTGITQHLTVPLPNYHEALSALISRCQNSLRPENKSQETPLTSQVLRAWNECVSWSAPAMLGAHLALHPDDEDEYVEEWAQFLFNNRHALAALLNNR